MLKPLVRTDEELTEEKVGLITGHVPVNRPGKLKKGLAVTAAGTSVIAVAAVPYLVLRSVFFLTTKKENFTFEEMIHTNETVFWIFGPMTALLATVAIAPFNMYNAYDTVVQIRPTSQGLRCSNFMRMISAFFLTFTGSVNGYNTYHALNDVVQNPTVKQVLQYPLVTISVIFAGVSDARVFLVYLSRDIPTDWRYLSRGVKQLANLAKQNISLFRNSSRGRDRLMELTKKNLLNAIRNTLDDLRMKILLQLSDTDISRLKYLCEDRQWIAEQSSVEFQKYMTIAAVKFPLARFIGSEVFGSTISGLLAYYGNQNTYAYTALAVNSFLEYCFATNENSFLNFISGSISVISYFTGFFVSFFLIRDLFFRDIFKTTTKEDLKNRLPQLIIPLIPAFSFGLLNVILTALNENLSPVDKVLVALAAIMGATVVTRYGIEGGIEQIRGRPNVRRELAGITDTLMERFVSLPYEELVEVNKRFNQITTALNNNDAEQNYEGAVGQESEDEQVNLSPQRMAPINNKIVSGHIV